MAKILSSIEWGKEFEGADVEACWNSFKDKIKFIPISQPRRRKKIIIYDKGNNTVNKQEGEASVYRRTNRLIDLDRYKLVRNQVNSAIHSDKVSETKAKLLSFKESYKAFYGYIRSKQKVYSHVAQLRKKDNTLTGSDEEVANELSSSLCQYS